MEKREKDDEEDQKKRNRKGKGKGKHGIDSLTHLVCYLCRAAHTPTPYVPEYSP